MRARRSLFAAAIIVALTSVYVNLFLNRSEAKVGRESLDAFPSRIGPWTGTDQVFPNRILENLGVDEYIMRRFHNGKDAIWLYIGYYKNQRDGAMPHSPRHCYPGSGWTPLNIDVATVPVGMPGKEAIRVNRYVFAKGLERECVIYWYQSRGRAVADEYWEKYYLVRDAILKRRTDGALIRFSTTATVETQGEAMKRLESFAAGIYPLIPRFVPD